MLNVETPFTLWKNKKAGKVFFLNFPRPHNKCSCYIIFVHYSSYGITTTTNVKYIAQLLPAKSLPSPQPVSVWKI